MKTRFTTYTFFVAFTTGLLLGCASTNSTSGNSSNSNSVSTNDNNSLTLVNYLRRFPSLQIDQRGSDVSVMVRGVSSAGGSNQPLFVVNNSPVGTTYQDAVNSVDVNDIKSVNVLQGTEGQQAYGIRGANGVIQIVTKSMSKTKN